MRYVGRITDWNDDKGFGFVTPNGGGDRAFVHVNAFARQGRRPVSGDLVAYTVQRDAKGRLNAAAVTFAGAPKNRKEAAGGGFPRRAVAIAAFAVLITAYLLHRLPFALVAGYALMSCIAFIAYALDKSAAQNGRWRTPESSLHAIALFGGWPGAMLAQDLFRHTSSKAAFQAVFWITAVANCGLLAWALQSPVLRG